MKSYEVYLTPDAIQDLTDIYEYITEKSGLPQVAWAYIEKLRQSCHGLRMTPLIGQQRNDLRKNLRDLNEHMGRECRSAAARYGVVLEDALITGIDPPRDVESALAAINTAYNQVSSDISLAQAAADQDQHVECPRPVRDAHDGRMKHGVPAALHRVAPQDDERSANRCCRRWPRNEIARRTNVVVIFQAAPRLAATLPETLDTPPRRLR